MALLPRRLTRLITSLVPCARCGSEAAHDDGLCTTCAHAVWGGVTPSVDLATEQHLLSLGRYEGGLRVVVHAVKFARRPRLATAAGRRLGEAIARHGWPVARIVPVPLHRSRRRERGFDQAERIACGVGEALGRPVWRGLRRVRRTERQARARAARRRGNVAGAFASAPLPPLPVLLVDDVWTTGTTARACRRALLQAGAREVRVAVVARAGADLAAATPGLAPGSSGGMDQR